MGLTIAVAGVVKGEEVAVIILFVFKAVRILIFFFSILFGLFLWL